DHHGWTPTSVGEVQWLARAPAPHRALPRGGKRSAEPSDGAELGWGARPAPKPTPSYPHLSTVIARLVPRLSGLTQCPLEAELGLALWRALLGVEQAIDALAMHEVGAHQSGEGERAFCD